MRNRTIPVILLIFFVNSLPAQKIDSLLNKIYKRALEQEKVRAQMGDYSYRQSVHFLKRDGDGEIEEQSKREFRVYARPPHLIKRVLVSAANYADGAWKDVTEEEKNKERKTESQQFSLTEMVSPENRTEYTFSITDSIQVDNDSLLQLDVRAVTTDEEHFDGTLLFRIADYSLVHAYLQPSETPTGIDSMVMQFELKPVGAYWLPSQVYLEAHIAFLFFFKGSIQTTITFSDYHLDQQIPENIMPDNSGEM